MAAAPRTARNVPEPWNHNVHYHRVILGAVPPGCRCALDVGCGTGTLTRRLRERVPQVTGIDRDPDSVAYAGGHPGAGDIAYLLGDFRAAPFRPESFDLVTSVAVLHHMDARAALRDMARLLRPGGILAVIGLACGVTPSDLGRLVPAVAGTRWHLASGAWQRRGAPGRPYQPPIVWPPPLTYPAMRRLAEQLLPGVRYRRHLYWRYSLVWAKPHPAE